jgi:uncharacterized membrane protein YozB (DUF420 family)
LDLVISYLPHVNASLNTLATVLLIAGFILIKRRQEAAHKYAMFAAFGTSVVFLICYLVYHFNVLHKSFPTEYGNAIRYGYYALLASHVLLAMSVPVLTVGTIYYGVVNNRPQHRRWAKITFPIWLYVSVTGVIVYLMLYHLFPAQPTASTMENGSVHLQEAVL